MKKIITLSVATLLCYNAIANNLIVNGDFEDEFLSPTWTVNQFNTSKQSTNPSAQSGNAYLRLANPNNQYAAVTQICQLKPSTQYKLTFYSNFAQSGNGYNYLYASVRGFVNQEDALANSNFLNLLNSGTPNYSIAIPKDAPAETEWMLNTALFTTTDTHFFLRFNVNKMYGIWNVDNIVIVEESGTGIEKEKEMTFKFSNTESSLRIFSPVNGEASIYNLNGMLLLRTNVMEGLNSVTIEAIPKGSYVVQINSNARTSETFKFVK